MFFIEYDYIEKKVQWMRDNEFELMEREREREREKRERRIDTA